MTGIGGNLFEPRNPWAFVTKGCAADEKTGTSESGRFGGARNPDGGRLESGSIWPAVVGHAAWNAVILGAFDGSTRPRRAGLWAGESGILVALTSAALVAWIVRGRLRTMP
jgi:hypothetical protein